MSELTRSRSRRKPCASSSRSNQGEPVSEPYEVLTFSDENFVTAVGSSTVAEDAVRDNAHTAYFVGYLEKLECATILLEPQYVDRDYLLDYAAYYARCFRRVPRNCRRLHFFSEPVTQEQVEHALAGNDAQSFSDLQDAYLGFIVVKPLPAKFYGRTCLVSYADEERRHFPARRTYDVNLAGDHLTVESLAFQEQDRDIAACATSAIWSALHKTGHSYGYRIPTPSEITKLADDHPLTDQRKIPNNGLSVYEIRQAIKSLGMEAEIYANQSTEHLLAVTYAYCAAGLPVILGYGLRDKRKNNLGHHAVTVAGYSLPERTAGFKGRLSSRIDKLYLHDDQAGPFSRATVASKTELETGFPGEHPPINAHDFVAIIPVDPKIRIGFNDANEYVNVLANFMAALQVDVEWELKLQNAMDFKREVRTDSAYDGIARKTLREAPLPKHVWLIRAWNNERLLLDVLLDATSLRSGRLICASAPVHEELRKGVWDHVLSQETAQEKCHELYGLRYAAEIIDLFREPGVRVAPEH